MNKWQKAQDWEAEWHHRMATNTYNEETKQFEYAKRMGIEMYSTPETPYNFSNHGKVLDIGGGDTSILLKVEDPANCVVVDPCDYAHWILERYASKGIHFIKIKGEDIDFSGFDEVWIYNVLQHVEDPEKVIKNARRAGRLIRLFEWIDLPVCDGHIHTLTRANLDKWLDGHGKVEDLNTSCCKGRAYFGIFIGSK